MSRNTEHDLAYGAEEMMKAMEPLISRREHGGFTYCEWLAMYTASVKAERFLAASKRDMDTGHDEVEVLKRKIHELKSRICKMDCRFTMGDKADISGSHCESPCDRCEAERDYAALKDSLHEAMAASERLKKRIETATRKVYLVTLGDGRKWLDRWLLVGIFSSREKAEACQKDRGDDFPNAIEEVEIDTWAPDGIR